MYAGPEKAPCQTLLLYDTDHEIIDTGYVGFIPVFGKNGPVIGKEIRVSGIAQNSHLIGEVAETADDAIVRCALPGGDRFTPETQKGVFLCGQDPADQAHFMR